MATKKIIAVVGATGAQGGSLVRAILADTESEFTPRAITRNPDSDKAKALAKAGAEVVRADIDDGASLERAFDGAHGAFLVTNFWEHFSPEREYAQAGNMARAAKKAGVKIGLCGQAPSDRPVFARLLVEAGIDSISFNPDALLRGIENISLAEKT